MLVTAEWFSRPLPIWIPTSSNRPVLRPRMVGAHGTGPDRLDPRIERRAEAHLAHVDADHLTT